MKREDFIQKFITEYLEGRDEDYCNEFLQRPIDKQYSAIQTWRRRKITKAGKEDVSAIDIIDAIKCTAAQVQNLSSLSSKETEKIYKAIDSLKDAVDNFETVLRQRRLKQLMEMRDQLEKQISELEFDVNKR